MATLISTPRLDLRRSCVDSSSRGRRDRLNSAVVYHTGILLYLTTVTVYVRITGTILRYARSMVQYVTSEAPLREGIVLTVLRSWRDVDRSSDCVCDGPHQLAGIAPACGLKEGYGWYRVYNSVRKYHTYL